MHTRAEPKRASVPEYDDVAADVEAFLRERMDLALAHGVAEEQIVLDPGPDFAKTPAQTVAVLRELARLHALGRPLLLAISRKYFLGAITGRPPAERLAGTLAAAAWATDAGAAILRVHDVAAVRDVLSVKAVLEGREEVPAFDGDDEELKWIRADR
jgi:dihydropteroate synthase